MYKSLIFNFIYIILLFSYLSAQNNIDIESENYGDRLKMGFVWQGDISFNPINLNYDYDQEFNNLVFGNGLFTKANDGHIIHNLAFESKVLSPTVFRFKLHPNIYFHDGSSITAEDVKFSYELYKKFALQSSFYFAARLIKSIEIYGSNIIRVKLEKPLDNFYESLGQFPILPKHIYNSLLINDKIDYNIKINPVGSGLYKFSKYSSEKLLQIEKNDKHFSRESYINGIDIIFYETKDQLLDAFLQEKVDLIKVRSKSTIQKINQFSGNLIKLKKEKKSLYYINLNTRKNPFNELAVRKALNFCINKNQIINTLFEQNGEIAINLFPELDLNYSFNNTNSDYFPLEGLQILLNKKYRKNSNGKLIRKNKELSFELLFEKGSSFEESISRIISINLGEIGVKVFPISIKPSVLGKKLKSGEYQAAIQHFEFNPNLIDETINNFYLNEINKQDNFSNYTNGNINKLIERISLSFDDTELNSSAEVFQQNLVKNIPIIFLFFNEYDYFALNSRFENYSTSYHQTTKNYVEKLNPKHEWFVKKDNHKY